jgi:hypothetical protein
MYVVLGGTYVEEGFDAREHSLGEAWCRTRTRIVAWAVAWHSLARSLAARAEFTVHCGR